jgi:squalene-hopene/tetraprenyl-beta-curcumene cyclase
MVDPDRLGAAYETARCDLLAEMAPAGHWIGSLSSSPLATAAAASALAIVERHVLTRGERIVDAVQQSALSELIVASLRWLARRQNADGGWGDREKDASNPAATMLVRSAFALTCVPADQPGLLERADRYIESQGGVRGLKRRHANDKTFAASILANGALAGLIPWSQVPPLPFELAALPARAWEFLPAPLAQWDVPLVVAVGQARWLYHAPRNPAAWLARRMTRERSLVAAEEMQDESGGFLGATLATAVVVMNLAGSGRAEHPAVRKGVDFLLRTARSDGSWPIVPDLATRNTAIAVGALMAAGEDPRELKCLDWLLARQQRSESHAGAMPGGWAATDGSGSLGDTWSTSGALLALAAWRRDKRVDESIVRSAAAGVRWLVAMQNEDGGWPMLCPGGRATRSKQSSSELTARALRALAAWRDAVVPGPQQAPVARNELETGMATAIEGGLRYLAAAQQPEGAWAPLSVGSPSCADEENIVLGAALVLLALGDLDRLDTRQAERGLDWLVAAQQTDGSWQAGPRRDAAKPDHGGGVLETSLAVNALLSCGDSAAREAAAWKGVCWLVDAVEANRHQEAAPIGSWLGRVGYDDSLCPMAAAVSALGQAASRLLPPRAVRAIAQSAKVGS